MAFKRAPLFSSHSLLFRGLLFGAVLLLGTGHEVTNALAADLPPATLTITTTSVPNGVQGVPYSTTITATGGTLPYTWSVFSGSLPTGLTLNASAGTISGTPTTVQTSSATIEVTDSSSPKQTAKKAFTFKIVAPLSITTASLPNGTVNKSYSATVSATGGTTPYTWSVASGSLPTGLTLGPGSGLISGIPLASGTFTFTIKVTDHSSPQLTATKSFTIVIQGALTIVTTSLPGGIVGVKYLQVVVAAGGTPPYKWSIASGSLPQGLSLNASTGTISGTPTKVQNAGFTLKVTDSSTPPLTAQEPLTISISAGVTITSGSPPEGTIGAQYSFTFTATGGTPPYTWSISSGSLPNGIKLTASTGVISGIPTTAQTANFAIKATDSQGDSATQTGDKISIFTPPPPPTLLLAIEVTPPAPNIGLSGTQQLTATGIYSNGTTQDFTSTATWASAVTGIATVSNGGLVTGVGPGMTNITATASGVTGFTLLNVGPVAIGSPNYYMATNGNDNWSGTLAFPNNQGTDGPFATLNRARQAVQGKPGSVVQIENGTYYLSAPVAFTSADSGTASAPIVYENYPGATPVISGGLKVTGWTNTSGSTWQATLSGSTTQNFESLFYIPAGAADSTRRYRPRLAPTGANCTVSGFLCNAATNPVIVSSESANCSVQVSGGWECFDRFYFNPGDLSGSGYHGMGLGDVEILDFEIWTMSRMRLSSVDTGGGVAYLTGPTFQNAQDNGFFSSHRYLVDNVLEALNQNASGQWYLDRCPGCANTTTTPAANWTLTYVAQAGENPSLDTVIIPQQAQLLTGNGANDIIFQGITFSHDNWIPGAQGLGDTSGIPGVTAAVSFVNSQNVIFNSCTFSHTQGWGVEFTESGTTGRSSSNQVVNSELYDLGAGGIRIGHWPNAQDTGTNVPQYNLVQNNIVVSNGRIQPSGLGTPIWVGNAHHNMIINNEVSDSYNGGIGIGGTLDISTGVGLAHDNVAAYNYLYTLGQGVTSDMGGIHFATSATKGNMMYGNLIHDVTHDWEDYDGYGGHGIYFDQGASNVVAQNNLVYRVSASVVFNNISDSNSDTYAQNNLVVNNILALGLYATINRAGVNPNSVSMIRNVSYYDNGAIQTGSWNCVNSSGKTDCPQYFFFDSNDYWNSLGVAAIFKTTNPSANYSLSEWQPLGEDVHSINQDPLFTDPNDVDDPPTDGFTLQSDSPAFTELGFVNFNAALAGRSNPVLVPPTVTCAGVPTLGACPAFPLQLLNPTNGY